MQADRLRLRRDHKELARNGCEAGEWQSCSAELPLGVAPARNDAVADRQDAGQRCDHEEPGGRGRKEPGGRRLSRERSMPRLLMRLMGVIGSMGLALGLGAGLLYLQATGGAEYQPL